MFNEELTSLVLLHTRYTCKLAHDISFLLYEIT